MKYFHIIKFLLTNDLTFLKECWELEFIGKKFSWVRLIKRLASKPNKYLFWYRLCCEMNNKGSKRQINAAKKISKLISKKYNIEISIKAKIGQGLKIGHYFGIAICSTAVIGRNALIRQNTTIGQRRTDDKITIGDNVDIGANSCILASNNKIGDNVTIGAMSFINKDVPDNCTVYTEKTNKIVMK